MRFSLVLLALLLTACSAPQPPLVVSALEITRPMPGMEMSAGYLMLRNNTDQPVRITSIASPQFESIEIHETTQANGVSRMRELDGLSIPAQDSVILERGGKHLMLLGPRDLHESVTMQFFSDDVPVLAITYSFPKDSFTKGERT